MSLSFSKPIEGAAAVVMSYGGGVNSFAMAMAAAHGLISPMPDLAIMAETPEGQEVQDHVRFAGSGNVFPFPLKIVSAGDLSERTLQAAAGQARNLVPFFVHGQDGRESQLNRGCTRDFKIRPVEKAIREHLGYGPRARIPKGVVVEQWIGIGAEEVHRTALSQKAYIELRYPLIELGWKRHNCEEFLRDNGYPIPPKSRCVFCPYTSDERWAAIKAEGGDEWLDAVKMDRAVRKGFLGSRSEAFVHRSLKPLEDVEFKPTTLDMFGHECRGYCGT